VEIVSEMLFPYPFSKGGLYLRIIGTFLCTTISFYLLFNTTVTEFILSFLVLFPASYTVLSLRNIFKTRKIVKGLSKEGRFIISRRKEISYYRFFALIMILTIIPFLLILIQPVITLGAILGFLCGHGFSGLTHYAYVKKLEGELGGEMYYFMSQLSEEGCYQVGVRVLKNSES